MESVDIKITGSKVRCCGQEMKTLIGLKIFFFHESWKQRCWKIKEKWTDAIAVYVTERGEVCLKQEILCMNKINKSNG